MKRLEDLPHFLIVGIKQGATQPNGYSDFALSGVFDKVEGVREERCWLLLPERDCLIGDLRGLDPEAKTAVFFIYSTSETKKPDVHGSKLPYLDGYWQAYHVWMVLEPEWIWKPLAFQSRDAVGRRFQADEVQVIDGQNVSEWIEVKDTAGRGNRRYYPVYPGRQAPFLIRPDSVIAAGWDHEHCELCRSHIESGERGYVDPSGHWVCEGCYAKYVSVHDLSFIGNLGN